MHPRPGACDAPALLTELCPRTKWWGWRVLPSLPLACQASALLVSYAPEVERMNGVAPSSQPWHGRILLLNHIRKNGVPSWTLTSNLTLRTRLLCVLSYGDKESNPWLVSSTSSHPARKKWIGGVVDLWIDGKTPTNSPPQ